MGYYKLICSMAGIYIHIPFCKQACNYCNFHFSTQTKQIKPLHTCLIKEIELQQDFFDASQPIETIYFGGGTPSLLEPNQIQEILQAIRSNFTVLHGAEITLEANPDNVNLDTANTWRQIGINRLSMGIQSFNQSELQWMNRAHDSKQAKQSLEAIIQAGFDNFSVDLIYGIPISNHQILKENLAILLQHRVPHLSCYALTVEEKTALHNDINKGKKQQVDDVFQEEQFLLLCTILQEHGYEHYEISNFAQPDCRSKHNSSYWQGKSYLGIGPSAHSYNGIERSWNVSNNALYMQQFQQDNFFQTKEELTHENKINEYIMISLRTKEGIIFKQFEALAQHKYDIATLVQKATNWQAKNYLTIHQHRIALTQQGKFFADGIAADLFI